MRFLFIHDCCFFFSFLAFFKQIYSGYAKRLDVNLAIGWRCLRTKNRFVNITPNKRMYRDYNCLIEWNDDVFLGSYIRVFLIKLRLSQFPSLSSTTNQAKWLCPEWNMDGHVHMQLPLKYVSLLQCWNRPTDSCMNQIYHTQPVCDRKE